MTFLPRRQVLALGASCAAAAALRALGTPGSARAQSPPAAQASVTARPGEEVLRVAKREVSPAGQRQQALVANETFPSYALHAREGEVLEVAVENAHDQPTVLHFHGVLAPNAMDGVAGVTQPPIAPDARFTYRLPLSEAGTFFYESTWQTQRQVGLAGTLVVAPRSPRHEVAHDEAIVLSDWLTGDPAHVVHGLRGMHAAEPGGDDPARLVNLLPDGQPFPIDVRYNAYLLNGRSHREAWTKEVKPGDRVRLRIVNAAAATFFRVQVEGHALEVVAADGRDVEPVTVDDLVVATGERYDVLLTVAGAGIHAVRAAALGASGGAVGVLYTPGQRPVVSTRPPKWGGRTLAYAQLRAVADTTLAGPAAKPVQIVLDGDAKRYLWTVDGSPYPGEFVTGDPSPAPPLALAAGTKATLELVNRTTFWQAMHLHGYRFRLLAASDAGARAPWKDTVAVPPGGKVALEIQTDSPGRWLLTATHLYRAQAGLARLLAVG